MDTVRELQAGLWHWRTPHPDWTPTERLLVFHPLSVPRPK